MKEERRQRFVAGLEKLGVGEVKQRIVKGVYGDPWRDIAQGWVEREASSGAAHLSLARQANRLAIVALIIAAISMIIAAFSLGVSGAFK
jgi:hypothetical protein